LAGLFSWGTKRPVEAPPPERPLESTSTTVVLPRFLAAMAPRSSPVLLDLGPAVGANVSFLGERLACKLLVGDLFHDLKTIRPEASDELRAALMARLDRIVTSPLDGVLAWDAFDYVDRTTAHAVAEFLAGRLTNGGVMHGFFGTAPGEIDRYARYFIQDTSTLVARYEPAVPRRRCVLSTRDLAVMFAGTKLTESVLLKTQRREILLKKG
jgi:hypothetical protein